MGSPNWAKLVYQGRARAFGVPWSAEEAKAIFELKIPADYVRRGAVTVEEMEELKSADAAHLKAHGEKPLEALSRAELREKAKEVAPQITNDAPEPVLRDVIAGARKKSGGKKKKA
jgi:hypothetical protein